MRTILSSRGAAALLATVVLACALVLGGCAGAPASTQPAKPEPPASNSADQLAAQALRSWAVERNPRQAATLAGQAATAAPDRPDLAWLHLRLCTQDSGCEPQPLETRLRKLAPENAAVWLSVLARVQRGDAHAAEQILGVMAGAQRFDLYWNTLVWRTATALRVMKPQPPRDMQSATPLTDALNDATGWLSQLMTSAFEPLSTACEVRRLMTDPKRRASCAGIAALLERGDAYVTEGVGLGLAQRLAEPGSQQADEVERRIETLTYRNRAAAAVMSAQVEREKFSSEVVELMRQLPREQDVSTAILRWAGQPLNP